PQGSTKTRQSQRRLSRKSHPSKINVNLKRFPCATDERSSSAEQTIGFPGEGQALTATSRFSVIF
ncbi:hypothetical protein NKI38_20740, partial [Mesorhizobium sp. M0621]|uniref:hypothetical protein n=1 Tax=Mesorhizobium sp. M0621 TaxID=2956974 RepID=UPI00333A670B